MPNGEFVAAIEQCEKIAETLYGYASQHKKSMMKTIGWRHVGYVNTFKKDPGNQAGHIGPSYFVGGIALLIILIMPLVPFSEGFSIESVGGSILVMGFAVFLLSRTIFRPKFRRLQNEILKIVREEWQPAFSQLWSLGEQWESDEERDRHRLVLIYNKFVCIHFVNRKTIFKMPNWVAANVREAEGAGISADKVIGNKANIKICS